MTRAFLGPINEVCSIWSQYSPKSQFFCQKFLSINIPSKDSGQVFCLNDYSHEFEADCKDFKLPFWCSYCGVLYYHDSIDRIVCRKCHIYRCGICELKSNSQGSSTKPIQKFISEKCHGLEESPAPGVGHLYYALDIGTSHQHVKAMIKFEINGKLEIFSMKIEPELYEVTKLP